MAKQPAARGDWSLAGPLIRDGGANSLAPENSMDRDPAAVPHHLEPLAGLNDLRILKLAQMHEQAFSRFVGEVATPQIQDESLRDHLAHIAPPTDRTHARLAAEAERLSSSVGANHHANRERALLLDILELAEAEREFYVRHMDELHDPRAVRLFRELVHVQEERVQQARRLLRAADARSSERKRRVGAESTLGSLLSEDDVPLREGVSDYGRSPR